MIATPFAVEVRAGGKVTALSPACSCDITNLVILQGVFDIVNRKDQKKNKGGRPTTTGTGQLIAVRMLPDLLVAIDKYQVSVQADSRPAAIRQAVTETLLRKGLL